jgi:hypothetical protein
MKASVLFDELAELVKIAGYKIVKDTGNFRSNNCILKDDKIIVLNKFANVEAHNKTLAATIIQSNLENNYIKPVIREYIDLQADNNSKTDVKEFNIQN